MSSLTERSRAAAEELMHDGISAAAARVLAKVGFQTLTMERVAQDAGVAKGTLYNYFRDKDELIGNVIERTFSGLVVKLERAMGDVHGGRAALRLLAELILEGMDERRGLGEILIAGGLSEAINNHLRQRQMWLRATVARKLAESAACGELRDDISADEAARMFEVLMHALIDERLKHPSDCPPIAVDVDLFDRMVLASWFTEVPA